LYVRSSDPIAKLKKPNTEVRIPLLENEDTRRIIKAHSLTFNIDNPSLPAGAPERINDTKGYLAPMGMAYPISTDTDFFSPDFKSHLSSGKPYADYPHGQRLSPGFEAYLKSQGVNTLAVEAGEVELRAKPEKGTYGCYGHESGPLGNRRFRQTIRQNLRDRGPYVVQPEMKLPVVTNQVDGRTFNYIDRNFYYTDGQKTVFMGGFRSLMPVHSTEAQNGRNHGSVYTVWAEVN
jgi:hypothetical protein